MTTTYTRTMLANEALDILQKVGLGQSPDAEDTEKIDRKIDALIEELAARSIVSIADAEDIPPAYFNPLAELLANEAAPNFGGQKNAAVREAAEERLKIMENNSPPPNKTLGVDESLPVGGRTGLSIASWTNGFR
jgi:hypothetical protein